MDISNYEKFARQLEALLYRKHFGLNVTLVGSKVLESNKLPLTFASGEHGFVVASNAIMLEGTIAQVNQQLRFLFLFAAQGLGFGPTVVRVTATDFPIECHPLDELRVPRTARLNRNISNLELCDDAQSRSTVTEVQYFIEKFNKPPTILIDGVKQAGTINVVVPINTLERLPSISIVDDDISMSDREQLLLNTSFGEVSSPPVSLVLRLAGRAGGRLSLERREGLVFLEGNGHLDRVLSVRGTILDINKALSHLRYVCTAVLELCRPATMDTLTILVDDDGYSGKGGPLQDTAKISILVQ
jgi:hypothetical protein